MAAKTVILLVPVCTLSTDQKRREHMQRIQITRTALKVRCPDLC